MTRTREEVLNEFGSAQCVKGDDCTDFDCVALNRMADAILTRDARIAALEAEVARRTEQITLERQTYATVMNDMAADVDALRQRAERAERVVEAAEAWEFAFRDPADPMGLEFDYKHDALLTAVRRYREGRDDRP